MFFADVPDAFIQPHGPIYNVSQPDIHRPNALPDIAFMQQSGPIYIEGQPVIHRPMVLPDSPRPSVRQIDVVPGDDYSIRKNNGDNFIYNGVL